MSIPDSPQGLGGAGDGGAKAQRLAAVPAQCALCNFESLILVICACAIFE